MIRHRNSRELLHKPKAVCEHEDITVLWNEGVQTESFWPVGQT